MKTTITENWSNWWQGPQPCLIQWNYEPHHVQPLKTDGTWWRVLTKCHWRKEWQTISVFFPWELREQYWKAKDMTLKDELPRSVGAQYATGEEWRNNSRKNKEMESKWKQYPVVDVTGDGSKVQCCKTQYCIGTWNVKFVNEGKLEVIKQEIARVNIDTLGISELKGTGMCGFFSDYHYTY